MSDETVSKLDKWLSMQVDAGVGALTFCITEGGNIGLFNDRDNKCLGVGTTAFGAIRSAMQRAKKAGENR